MAKKKAEVAEEVKDIAEVVGTPVESTVEESPKETKTTKKSTAKKKTTKKVETPTVEEVAEVVTEATPKVEADAPESVDPIIEDIKVEELEPEIVEEPVKETPVTPVEKPVKAKSETKASGSYQAVVSGNGTVDVRCDATFFSDKLGAYRSGIRLTILEEKNGWGKLAENKWIPLNYITKI